MKKNTNISIHFINRGVRRLALLTLFQFDISFVLNTTMYHIYVYCIPTLDTFVSFFSVWWWNRSEAIQMNFITLDTTSQVYITSFPISLYLYAFCIQSDWILRLFISIRKFSIPLKRCNKYSVFMHCLQVANKQIPRTC